MLKEKLIDGIIAEPLGGAHYEPAEAFASVKDTILKNIKAYKGFTEDELATQRQENL